MVRVPIQSGRAPILRQHPVCNIFWLECISVVSCRFQACFVPFSEGSAKASLKMRNTLLRRARPPSCVPYQ